jgi:riboflavin transporter FmnP
MLVAMEIVLNRFVSIKTPFLKIGLSFVPVVMGAMLYGPVGGAEWAAWGT